jgi:hypothetical protein
VYRVSDNAIAHAKEDGMRGMFARTLAAMGRRASPVTSEYGNWRFRDWLLTIDGDIICDAVKMCYK